MIIEELPHLFVSWSEPEQLVEFYQDLLDQLLVKLKAGFISVALCVPEQALLANQSQQWKKLTQAILLRESGEGISANRVQFMTQLWREYQRRKKMQKTKALPGAAYLKPLLILVDDLIDLVVTRNKQTGLYFLELLRNGPAQKIHFIMGSTRTYRGLVRQLIQYEKEGEPSILDHYLPELVISPEGLFFYKRPEELNYTRLFSLREGESPGKKAG